MSPDRLDLDLLVIGAGTGAQRVARGCAEAGWTVAIVDNLPYGGTCALRGCDPKKMLVGVTEALDRARRMTGNGLAATAMAADWSEMIAFKRTFTDAVPRRLEEGFGRIGVETLHGTASFASPGEVEVGGRTTRARYFHIATGARPATLDIRGEELVSTSTDFLELPALPPRIVFIGGGFISFEFAHIAQRAGASEVTIAHRGDRPLQAFDPDLVDLQVRRTRELGIDVRLETAVTGIERRDGALAVRLSGRGQSETVACDLVVHGAGRVPDLERLDLDRGDIAFGPRGIVVSEFMRSVSNSSVFAAGDCADTGAPKLTPVSANEGRIALKNLLAGEDARKIVYPPIPTIVFTVPPLGAVGLSEVEARTEGLHVDVHYRETGAWYSSLRVGEKYSAYKVLVDRGSGRIVGAHLLGPGVEEQINVLAMAMGAGLTANEIKAVVFAYPTYASDLASML